jgi:chaperonin cofactor prefoldin
MAKHKVYRRIFNERVYHTLYERGRGGGGFSGSDFLDGWKSFLKNLKGVMSTLKKGASDDELKKEKEKLEDQLADIKKDREEIQEYIKELKTEKEEHPIHEKIKEIEKKFEGDDEIEELKSEIQKLQGKDDPYSMGGGGRSSKSSGGRWGVPTYSRR